MKARIRIAAAFVLLAGAGLIAGQSPTQEPAPQGPTFKTQVEYVEVDAVVTDQQGNFVRNLKKEDFQVFEDGRPQSVANFTVVDIPIERVDELARLLGVENGKPVPPGQALVRAPMPCGGLGECGVCALRVGRRGMLLCVDGPVVELRTIL